VELDGKDLSRWKRPKSVEKTEDLNMAILDVDRVRDYRESKERYRNDVITSGIVTPLKRNALLQKNYILSCQIIDLEFVY